LMWAPGRSTSSPSCPVVTTRPARTDRPTADDGCSAASRTLEPESAFTACKASTSSTRERDACDASDRLTEPHLLRSASGRRTGRGSPSCRTSRS
jgi:hypothetical protein